MRISLLLLSFFLASCSSFGEYKMPIQQGNYVTQEKVDELSPGMTRTQVQSILGSPLIVDAFHRDRWDYVYRMADRNTGKVEENRLTVLFDGDSMTRVDGKGLPKAPLIGTPVEDKGFMSKLLGWF